MIVLLLLFTQKMIGSNKWIDSLQKYKLKRTFFAYIIDYISFIQFAKVLITIFNLQKYLIWNKLRLIQFKKIFTATYQFYS